VVSLTLTPMMCARLLRHTPDHEQGRFYRASQDVFDRTIAAYGRTLRWVLQRQPATLAVTVAVFVLTIILYVIVPKGFFPVQDTGVILGISEAPQSISFAAMAERQQALAALVLEDSAVASLSSFIGVDGTNTTLNSGRIVINLKPLEERDATASEIIRRLQPRLAAAHGIRLYLQPIQDLTVENRVSRTQFQYTLEDANAAELDEWTPRVVEALQARPELRDVSSDQQNEGLSAVLTIDRATKSSARRP
jgi:multidrug efflux pump